MLVDFVNRQCAYVLMGNVRRQHNAIVWMDGQVQHVIKLFVMGKQTWILQFVVEFVPVLVQTSATVQMVTQAKIVLFLSATVMAQVLQKFAMHKEHVSTQMYANAMMDGLDRIVKVLFVLAQQQAALKPALEEVVVLHPIPATVLLVTRAISAKYPLASIRPAQIQQCAMEREFAVHWINVIAMQVVLASIAPSLFATLSMVQTR